MISSIASFVWYSAPVMTAIFTTIFLILIRAWSRDPSSNKIKSGTKKLGDAVESSGKVAKSFCDTTFNDDENNNRNENKNDITDDKKHSKHSKTDNLDTLFFGELFLSAAAAGLLISFGWK